MKPSEIAINKAKERREKKLHRHQQLTVLAIEWFNSEMLEDEWNFVAFPFMDGIRFFFRILG